ncbi:hypothetical protein F2Q68_00040204 [Brassica cretica]|uniref:Uncharacterized protein n=1 Tax=Brassica cretica TaxID=69181 RepID=A0A8S9MLY2_BRACR|nr:hypothetical protein F2Q68_00040204 [Brassica cretica]
MFFGTKTVLSFQLFLAMKLSGVSNSVKTNDEAAIPSNSVKPVSQTGVSSGDDNPIKNKGATAVSKSSIKPVTQTGISSGVDNPVKSKGATAVSKSPIKPNDKTGASSGPILGVRGRASVSPVDKGKSIVSDDLGEVITFKDVTFGPHQDEVRFRLIHFGRLGTFRRRFLSASKCFSSMKSSIRFPEDRICIHGFREFDAASDLRGDLYDYIGHIKLVNGKVPSDGLLLDEAEIVVSRRVELHVQTHDDPVMKLYLWDKAAFEFSEKFKASGGTARVILVTTLNPKRFGGVLSLSAMASSRVFIDSDVQETLFYLSWLNSNLDVASGVNEEVITKPEPATFGELFSYMNQASSKAAVCAILKQPKGPQSLCVRNVGRVRLLVWRTVFVVLGDAGEELTGKKASELVERYYQANDSVGGDHMVLIPQAMVDTIGQTRKFIVKVSNHNLTANTQTLTVTKVLPPDAPESEGSLGSNVDEKGDTEGEDNAAELGKRGVDVMESEGVKRAKCG